MRELIYVGECCVVTEIDDRTGKSSLYGVFTNEESARRDYGRESAPYTVRFDTCRIAEVPS